jgi:hypothetical protein
MLGFCLTETGESPDSENLFLLNDRSRVYVQATKKGGVNKDIHNYGKMLALP